MGSLAQISSGAIRCSFNQVPRKVPEGSGADTYWGTWWGSGGFRCRYLVRFRRVPVQIPGEVLEGSGADTCWGSGEFRCRYLTKALVNCTGSRRRDQGCNHHFGKLHGWQAQRPGIGTAFCGNVSYARAQHYTKWWFCLVSRFSVFHTLTCQILIVMMVNADSTCEINVLWMRYSTLKSQFSHEVHVWDPFVTQFEVFEMFFLCLWDVPEVCFVSLTF